MQVLSAVGQTLCVLDNETRAIEITGESGEHTHIKQNCDKQKQNKLHTHTVGGESGVEGYLG